MSKLIKQDTDKLFKKINYGGASKQETSQMLIKNYFNSHLSNQNTNPNINTTSGQNEKDFFHKPSNKESFKQKFMKPFSPLKIKVAVKLKNLPNLPPITTGNNNHYNLKGKVTTGELKEMKTYATTANINTINTNMNTSITENESDRFLKKLKTPMQMLTTYQTEHQHHQILETEYNYNEELKKNSKFSKKPLLTTNDNVTNVTNVTNITNVTNVINLTNLNTEELPVPHQNNLKLYKNNVLKSNLPVSFNKAIIVNNAKFLKEKGKLNNHIPPKLQQENSINSFEKFSEQYNENKKIQLNKIKILGLNKAQINSVIKKFAIIPPKQDKKEKILKEILMKDNLLKKIKFNGLKK